MNEAVRRFRDFVVSLKLTVVLIALGMVLIFAATLSQVDLGVWGVQQQFFHSFFAVWHVGPLFVPLPGGYLVGGALLINLIAAHVYRFKFTWRKSGIFFTHVGVILLLIGELLSGLWQEVYQMKIDQDQTLNYAEHERHYEVAITDTTDPKFDEVVAIPEELIARGEPLQYPKLPFRVVPRLYYPNSISQPRAQVPNPPPSPATTGILSQRFVVTPQAVSTKDDNNTPAAVIELVAPEASLGAWQLTSQVPVLTTVDGEQRLALAEPLPQRFDYGGHTWSIALRRERAYKPFAITLLELRHDVYPGTDIPKNFSSRVRLTTPDGRDDREVLIFMNNPLRYAGLTFYQYQMNAAGNYTVLQVVRNPSWQLPYISCALVALGLVVQFGIHLFGFFGKRRNHQHSAA